MAGKIAKKAKKPPQNAIVTELTRPFRDRIEKDLQKRGKQAKNGYWTGMEYASGKRKYRG